MADPQIDLPPEADAFVNRVRKVEGTAAGSGYVKYGNTPFTPEKDFPKWEGVKVGDTTTHAAGPGQWQPDTWNEVKDKFKGYGVDLDFSNEQHQKAAIWDKGYQDYKKFTGRDLREDLKANKVEWDKLAPTWQGFTPRVTQTDKPGGKIDPQAIAYEQSRPHQSVWYFDPQELLSLLPEQSADDGKTKRKSLAKSLGLGDDIYDLPQIEVSDKGDTRKISGFDGRNRLQAMIDAGLTAVPVTVKGLEPGVRPQSIEGMTGKTIPIRFDPVPTVPREPPASQKFASGVRSALIEAPTQMLAHALPERVTQAIGDLNNRLADAGVPLGRIPQGGIDEYERQRQAELERNKTAGSLPYVGGEIAATLAPGTLAAKGVGALAGAARLPGIVGTALGGAAGGAVGGVMEPVTSGDFAQEKAKQAELGAAGGAVAAPAGQALGAIIKPEILPAAQRLMDRGVQLTPGQLHGGALRATEEATTSVPFSGAAVSGAYRRGVEDFNQAAYNEVLSPLGQKYAGKEIGYAGIDKLNDQLSKEFDRVKGMIDLKADRTMIKDFTDLAGVAKEMPPSEYTQFKNIFNNRIAQRFGTPPVIDGQTFKDIESELSQLSRNIWKDMNSTAGQKQLAGAMDELNAIMRDGLERQNPHARAALQKINEAWAKFVRVRDAAANRGSSLGVFTPGDLLTAEKRNSGRRIFSRGKGALQGLATDAQEVLGARYPDSGTARRYATIGEGAELAGLILHNPVLAAGQLAAHGLHAAAYSSPGLNLLRAAAGAGFPKTRNALAGIVRPAGNALAPIAGMAAASGP